MSIFQLRNPIPYEQSDSKDVATWIGRYKCIPYYGTAQGPSHAFLGLLRDLCGLSPTYGTVMQVRKELAFGHRVKVCGRAVPGLAGERTEVDYAVQVGFVEVLQAFGLTLPRLIKMSGMLDEHLAQSGNAYLAITRARVEGAVAYRFEVLHYLHCIYTESQDPGEWFLLHTRKLSDAGMIAGAKPRLYRVTREVGSPLRWMADEEDPDTERTVIHLRSSMADDEGNFYGRAPIIRFMPAYYTDFQTSNHISKVAATAILAKKVIAIEGQDPNAMNDEVDEEGNKIDTFQRDAFEIKRLLTVLSVPGDSIGPRPDQAEVAVVEHPFGSKPPTAIDFEVNHDTKYLQFQEQHAANFVAASLSWDVTLTSLRQAQASLGGNLLYDTYVEKNREVIAPKQDLHENLWNGILQQLMEDEGTPAPYRDLGIEFPDAVGELLKDLKPIAPSAVLNGAPGSPDAPDAADELNDDDDGAA